MAPLQTEDLIGVEILEAGVEIHGVGSPPEGDKWTPEDLRGMAAAAQELEAAGEFDPPARVGDEAKLGKAKLGHGKEQKLLADSELPAAGWLSNQRVSEDGMKLLADVKSVPKKVADLIKAKAYAKRSSELGTVKSHKTGKTHPWVVTGLAWLGGKMPAVRTLDEVVAQYEEAGIEVLRVVEYEVGEPDDTPEVENDDAADTRPSMKDFTLDEKAQRELEALIGLKDDEKLTPERLLEAVKARKNESGEGEGGTEGSGSEGGAEGEGSTESGGEESEAQRKLEARVEAAEKTVAETAEKLRLEERRYFIDDLAKSGKIEPGEREKWETRYDTDAELTRKFAEDLKVRPELVREYGSDVDGEEEDEEAKERDYEADADGRLGIPKEQVI